MVKYRRSNGIKDKKQVGALTSLEGYCCYMNAYGKAVTISNSVNGFRKTGMRLAIAVFLITKMENIKNRYQMNKK